MLAGFVALSSLTMGFPNILVSVPAVVLAVGFPKMFVAPDDVLLATGFPKMFVAADDVVPVLKIFVLLDEDVPNISSRPDILTLGEGSFHFELLRVFRIANVATRPPPRRVFFPLPPLIVLRYPNLSAI